MSSSHTYKLSYFNGRGGAEASRYLLAIGGVKYEDHRYPVSMDNGKYVRPEFDEKKDTHKYGRLPELTYDNVQIPQSKAIERFIAKQIGLFGSSDVETALIDATSEQIRDIGVDAYKMRGNEEAAKKFFDSDLAGYLKYLEKQIPANSNYLVNNKLSLADVQLYTLLTQIAGAAADPLNTVLKSFPNVVRVRDTVGAIEAVKKWEAERPQTPW